MSAIKWIQQLEKILIDSEVTSNDYFARIVSHNTNYHRIEFQSKVGWYDINKKSLKTLELEGAELLKQQKKQIEKIIRDIIDEKYGQK